MNKEEDTGLHVYKDSICSVTEDSILVIKSEGPQIFIRETQVKKKQETEE